MLLGLLPICFGSSIAVAQTIENGVLTSCQGVSGKYTIPKEVHTIGKFAFYSSSVKEIIITPQVVKIDTMAFYSATKLEKVVFEPNSQLETMGEDVFNECLSLTSISLPTSLKKIGARTFFLAGKLKEVTLPDDLEAIPPYMFQSCEELSELTLPKQLKTIGENAFSGCTKLVEIQIPSCDSIATKAFYKCNLLGEITLPKNLRSIADSAFMRCERLKTFTLPEGVEKVGAKLFNRCSKLKTILVDAKNKHFTSVDGVLFSADKSVLYEVPLAYVSDMYILPQETEKISHMAFFDCHKVGGITLHDKIQRIGIGALCNNGFKEIKFGRTEKYYLEESNLYYRTMNDEGQQIEVLMARATHDPSTYCYVKYGTVFIADYALMGCEAIQKISFPSTLLGLGEFALANCSGLKDLNCYAPTPPQTKEFSFANVNGQVANMHVYPEYLKAYTIAPGWNLFVYGSDLTGDEPMTSIADPVVAADVRIIPQENGVYVVYSDEEIEQLRFFNLNGQQLVPSSENRFDGGVVYYLPVSVPHIVQIVTHLGISSHKVL